MQRTMIKDDDGQGYFEGDARSKAMELSAWNAVAAGRATHD
jgi:hypothetical protein